MSTHYDCGDLNSVAGCLRDATVSMKKFDQVGRFFALWATIQSWWQQFFFPKMPTLLGNFSKGVKIIHFSSEIIFGQLI